MVDRTREGFSLIEMLVALAVFSLAALALLNLSGESTRSASRVEDRTLGEIVADNVAAESLILPAVADGNATGRITLAGRGWDWSRTIAVTDDPDIQRIVVRVSTDEGQVSDRTLFRTRGG